MDRYSSRHRRVGGGFFFFFLFIFFFCGGFVVLFLFPPPLVSWKEHHHVPRCVHINAERVRLTENVQSRVLRVHTDEDFQSCESRLDAVCTVQSTQSLHSATAAAAAGINSTRSFFPVYTSPTCLPVQCNRSYFEFAHCYCVWQLYAPVNDPTRKWWMMPQHRDELDISFPVTPIISLYTSSECLFWARGGVVIIDWISKLWRFIYF